MNAKSLAQTGYHWRILALATLICLAHSALAREALLAAIEADDLAAVERLLAEGADPDEVGADGASALQIAARDDRREIAARLLAAGATADAPDRYGVTPLTLAAANGNAAIVELLLDAGADPDTQSREGETVLMSAALNGREPALRLLIDRGATVDASESFRGQTALMWAAAAGNRRAVEVLIDAGADVATRSHAGFSALLFAVRENRIETAQRLLELGADVEDKAPDGTSALNMAVLNAYYEMAMVLLERGADPNAADPRGSALHTLAWLHKPGSTWDAAALSAEPETAPRPGGRVDALELARALLEHGADPNRRVYFQEQRFTINLGTTRNLPGLMLGRHYLSYNGATPYYVAARNGDYRLMQLLTEFGADGTIPTVHGVTPLMAAAGLDYYEGETPGPFIGVPEAERLRAVELALDAGNEINARTEFGDYPMLGTPEFTLLTYPPNIDDLLDLGVGDPRFDGMTALHGAVISNQPSILRFLLENGAEVDAANRLGWTPLMLARGIFLANARKDFPVAAEILIEAGAQLPDL